MGKNKKEIYPEWLSGYRAYDPIGGFEGSLVNGTLGDNLSLWKEKFPGGWLFSATPEGDLGTSIICMKGVIAVQNHDLTGAMYRESTGDLIKAKFSVRSTFSRYDSLRDSFLTKMDQELILRMYDFDVDLLCEVEFFSGIPILNLVLVDRMKDGSLQTKYLDKVTFDPSRYGFLGGDYYPRYQFLGSLGSLEKIVCLRVYEDRVSVGIIEDRGGERNLNKIENDDYREMFEISRQNTRLSKFGNELVKKKGWLPMDIVEINEVLGSVCPDFGFDSSI